MSTRPNEPETEGNLLEDEADSSAFDTDEISSEDRLKILYSDRNFSEKRQASRKNDKEAADGTKTLDDLQYFSMRSDRGDRNRGTSNRGAGDRRPSERGGSDRAGGTASGRTSASGRRSAGVRDQRSDRGPGDRKSSRGSSPRRQSRRRRTRIKFIVMGIVLALLVILLVLALMVNNTLAKMNRVATSPRDIIDAAHETFDFDTDKADTIDADAIDMNLDDIEVMKDNNIANILLIGQDHRSGSDERTRSDTMVICSINTKNDTISLTSLMRDMYVEIPGYSNNKLNAAYAFGGMELLDETIKKNFGIVIDANVEVDFEGFLETVTRIGTLNINLTAEEAEFLNTHNGYGSTEDLPLDEVWTLKEGVNTLTPEQTLAYSRIRYVGNSDFDRVKRQQTVLMAAFQKIRGGSLKDMIDFTKKVLPYFTTDMSDAEVFKYVKTIVTNDISTINTHRIPEEGTYSAEIIRNMSVLVTDLPANSDILRKEIYEDDTSSES